MKTKLSLILILCLSVILNSCGKRKQETIVNVVSNNPPIISKVETTPSSVQVGGMVLLNATAIDQDENFLNYYWTSADGKLSSTVGQQVSWTAPSTTGTYHITLMVTDGRDIVTGDVSVNVVSAQGNNQNPVISSLTANPTSINTGETSTITVSASDTDGDSIISLWTATGGLISGSGNSITWTSPSSAGTYTVSVVITDEKGGSASGNTQIIVKKPQATLSSISITPTSLSINVNNTKQFFATGIYSDGSKIDLTALVIWSSSNANVGTINSSGLFTANANGTTNITAIKDNITSNSVVVCVNVWQKTYGGSNSDSANSIQQTSDGGYIVAGETWSFGAGSGDFYIIKLNRDGNKIWEKTYGGKHDDQANSISQTTDGGYIVAGYTYSFSGPNDCYGTFCSDFYIIKLDVSGNKVWEKTYDRGEGWNVAYSIQQTKDGGYIVAGNSVSLIDRQGWCIYIIKLDASGNKIWEKTYGESDGAWYSSAQQTTDGGYIVAGTKDCFGCGSSDIYIIKLDANGNKIWEKTYGGSGSDRTLSFQQTTDGGYIAVGEIDSFGAGRDNFYIIKLDSSGNKIWDRTYGGSGIDEVKQTSDGGYIVAGRTDFFGAGKDDIYIIKLDAGGNKIWEKTYGGSSYDKANSIQQTSDGGYIIGGSTWSFGAGKSDFYVIKTDTQGNTGPNP